MYLYLYQKYEFDLKDVDSVIKFTENIVNVVSIRKIMYFYKKHTLLYHNNLQDTKKRNYKVIKFTRTWCKVP